MAEDASVLVERETHLLELARYIVLNPVRAGMAQAAEPCLGSEGFIEAQRERLDDHVSQSEVPRRERLAHRPRLEEVLSPEVVSDRSRRNERMRWLTRTCGYPLADVGRHVGLHYASVSRIVSSHEDEPSSMLKYKT